MIVVFEYFMVEDFISGLKLLLNEKSLYNRNKTIILLIAPPPFPRPPLYLKRGREEKMAFIKYKCFLWEKNLARAPAAQGLCS